MVRQNNDPCIGIGGAPTRCSTLPRDASERKRHPIASGVLDYFPDALAAVARVSWQGNEQHNPGQPLHWARGKSADEADTMMRHFLQRGTLDGDGTRHSAKMVWRALALLQKEIEGEKIAEKRKIGPGEILTYEPPAHGFRDGTSFNAKDEHLEERIEADVKTVMDDHHVNYVPAKKMGEQDDLSSLVAAPDQNMCVRNNPNGVGVCTREEGHAGIHVAHGTLNHVINSWN